MIPIMMAIYVNMAFPYFAGRELIFIAYAVVSCVQLGSTIDYAISSTENYLQTRAVEPDKRKAAIRATQLSFPSILTSGVILIVCGYVISFMSSIPAISQVGHLVGRGAIFSVTFVTLLMPCLLQLADRFITVPAATKRARRRAAINETIMGLRERRRARHHRVKELLGGHGAAASEANVSIWCRPERAARRMSWHAHFSISFARSRKPVWLSATVMITAIRVPPQVLTRNGTTKVKTAAFVLPMMKAAIG